MSATALRGSVMAAGGPAGRKGSLAEYLVLFEPLDVIASLAVLVPKPRVNLTRFHGVFAPNSTLRAQITRPNAAKVKKPQRRSGKTQRPPNAAPD